MSRLYDPQNPRLLTPEEIARLSPAECAAACEELDQNILSTLLSIDANFAETTRIVTDVLIPIVERYGKSSKQIWDSVKLWKAFFEASAGLQSGSGADEEEEYESDHEPEGDTTARGEEHEAAEEHNAQEQGDSAAILAPITKSSKSKSDKSKSKRVSTTPPSSSSEDEQQDATTNEQEHEFAVPPRRPGTKNDGRPGVEPSWADDTSPFEQLRQDIQKVRLVDSSSYSTSSSYHAPPFAPSSIAAKKQQQERQHLVQEQEKQKQEQQPPQYKVQQTRLRDLSMDSPDFERPALQTMSFQHPRERLTQQYNQAPLPPAGAGQDKGKGRAYQVYDDAAHPNQFDDLTTSSAIPDTPASLSTLSDLSSIGGPTPGAGSAAQEEDNKRPSMNRRKSSSNQNALLQKVLMKNLVGKDGRPNVSTPATKRLSKTISKAARKSQIAQQREDENAREHEQIDFYPKDLPSGWNGLADLSKAPLSAFESPQKKASSDRYRNLGSTMQHRNALTAASGTKNTTLPSSISTDSLFDNSIFRDTSTAPAAGHRTNEHYQPPSMSAYKSRLSRTPAKEAARLITRDVLQKTALREGGDHWEDAGLMDSPALDPPSVVKNWATRGYTTHFPPPESVQKSTTRSGNASAGTPTEEGHSQQLKAPLLVPLAEGEGEDSFEAEFDDENAGTAPPPQPNFGHLADEGDERLSNDGGSGGSGRDDQGDDWGDSFEDRSGDEDNSAFDEPAQIPLNDEHGHEGDSFSDNSRSLDDETVFGAKRARASYHDPHAAGGFGLHPGENLHPNSHQAHLFRLQAQSDMVTLHGGNLLESQPFEASPLAGRDARYGL